MIVNNTAIPICDSATGSGSIGLDMPEGNAFCHGHTLSNEPIMIPARKQMVSVWYFFRSQERKCEKDTIPMAAPTTNTRITGMSSSAMA